MLAKKIGMNKISGFIFLLFLISFPLFASKFHIGLMGKFIVFILFALALDLIWGYTGLLSLGHAVFFGLGGYLLALSYTIQDGVPTFMTSLNVTEIPAIMKPLESVPVAFILGLVLPALFAAFFGYFIFKSTVSGVYFSILTLALAKLFEMSIINMQAYTGGFNGLMGLTLFPIFGKPLQLTTYYYLVLTITLIVYCFCHWLAHSHFGKVLQSIRENESRTRFFSYNPVNYKIFVFTVSGFLSGLAGMLYVPMNGFISPRDVGIAMSTMVVIWLAIGGRGTLMGAVFGVLTVNWLSNILSELYPNLWQLFFGLFLVLIVLFLPDGVYGSLEKWWRNRYLSGQQIKGRLLVSSNRNKEVVEDE